MTASFNPRSAPSTTLATFSDLDRRFHPATGQAPEPFGMRASTDRSWLRNPSGRGRAVPLSMATIELRDRRPDLSATATGASFAQQDRAARGRRRGPECDVNNHLCFVIRLTAGYGDRVELVRALPGYYCPPVASRSPCVGCRSRAGSAAAKLPPPPPSRAETSVVAATAPP